MDVMAGYKKTEAGVIPEDWDVSTVGNEFSIQLGKMLDSERNIGVPKPYLGNRAVQWGRIDLNDIGMVKMTSSDLQRFRLRPGDLLVCEGGDIGRAAIWDEAIPECYYQKALHRLRPTHGYNVPLMLNMLQWWASTGFLLNFVTQTSIAHLPKEKFEKVPLPIPPSKAEHEAIAEALGDTDTFIKFLEQLITKKRRIKQGAMRKLLTGTERLPGFGNKHTNCKKTEIGVLPADWEVRQLGDLGTFKNGINKGSEAFGHGSPFVNLMDVFGVCAIASTEELGLVASTVFEQQTYNLKRGDVIFIRSSVKPSGVGLTALVEGDLSKTVYSGFLIRFRDGGLIDINFKKYCFYEEGFRKRVIAASSVSANTNINQDNLKQLLIGLPPTKAEQEAIAKYLSDMDTEIAALESKLAKYRHIKQGMMHQLLTGKIRLV